VIAGFMAAIPVAIGVGAPTSTALLGLDGIWGIAGWKWLFLCEAAPAVIIGFWVWFYDADLDAGRLPGVLVRGHRRNFAIVHRRAHRGSRDSGRGGVGALMTVFGTKGDFAAAQQFVRLLR
jgi:hypothetical protein